MVRTLDAATGGKKANKKGGPVVLSAEQVGAFEDAKDLLCDAVKRARFEPTWQTLLVTDASDVGCGAARYQRPPDAGSGAWRPIAFWSKAFSSGAAVRWPVWEKELFALFSAGKLWRGFIAQGKQRTIVWTDSRVVSHFRSAQWGGGAESSKVLGWAMLLSTLRIDVSHIRGDTNIAADFLSREVAALGKEGLLGERPLRLDDPVLEDLELDEPLSLRVIRTADNEGGLCLIPFDTRASEADVRVWEAAYLACPDYGTDFRRLQAESGGGGTAAAGPTQLYRGVLQKGSVVLVPLALRLRVVQEMHKRLGHLGETKLVMALRERFEFLKLRSEARCIVSTCGTCCLLKGDRRLRAVLNAPIPPPVSRWADVCMDFMFLDPVRDHRGGVWDKVLLVVDMCSRYVIAMPAKRNDTAPSMWKDVRDRVFSVFGVPSTILTDQDPLFVSRWTQQQATELGIRWRFATAAHPQTDGLSERSVQTVKQRLMLAGLEDPHKNWVDLLAPVMPQHNASPNSRTGLSPHELVFGQLPSVLPEGLAPPLRSPNISYDDWVGGIKAGIKRARETHGAHATKLLEQLQSSRLPEVGSFVAIWNRRPPRAGEWRPLWVGPYCVQAVRSGGGHPSRHRWGAGVGVRDELQAVHRNG